MGHFYDINSARITVREFWWGTRSPLVLVALILKLLRVRIDSSTDDPNVDSLAPFKVDPHEIPQDIRESVADVERDLDALGFHSPVIHYLHDHKTHTRLLLATFRHDDGETLGRIFYRHWTTPHPARLYVYPVFISAFEDGTYLVSSAGPHDMLWPECCHMNRMLKAGAAELLASHRALLATPAFQKPVRMVGDDATNLAVVESFHQAHFQFHLERGVFVPRAEPEASHESSPPPLPAAGEHGSMATAEPVRHPEVYAEIEKIQHATGGGWGRTLITLGVTALLFIGAGSVVWSWDFALMLIPILLFHELGHYLAMRVFRYRNLKMFFIPFLGAAVTGHHYNVAGWKKAVVSLMGPVPGIFAGAALGAAGLILGHPWMVNAAMLTLILNGFNLLPVLPLDGGWVMHTVLFSRNYLLDIGFRLLAGLSLLAGWMFLDDRVLMFLSFAVLFGIPANLKTGKISHEIARMDLPKQSPDSESLPRETGDQIIDRVKEAFPKGVNAKNIAQMTLNIFESINARPPNWFVSVLLLGVQIGGIIATVVLAVLLTVGKEGDLAGFMDLAARAPETAFECGTQKTVEGTGYPDLEVPTLTIVATSEKPADAAALFDSLSSNIPAAAAVRLIGSSVLASVPGDDDALRERILAEMGPNAFVASTNFPAPISVSFIARDAAQADELDSLMGSYFLLSNFQNTLLPPWFPDDSRSVEERARHQRARRTLRELQTGSFAYFTNQEHQAILTGIETARRRGDTAELSRLQARAREVQAAFQEAMFARMVEAGESVHDLGVVELFKRRLRLIEEGESTHEINGELNRRLGELPPSTAGRRFDTDGGYVERSGLIFVVDYIQFTDLYHGFPALLEWLCGQDVLDIKYRVADPGLRTDFDDLEE